MADDAVKKTVTCPSCQTKYKVSEQFADREVACKNCGNTFKVIFAPPIALDEHPNAETSISTFEKYYRSGTLMSMGELCLHMGLGDPQQLQEVMDSVDDSELAGILVQRGLIKPEDVDNLSIIRQMQKARGDDLQFGQLAIHREWASPEDVNRALAEQDRIFTSTTTIALIGDIMVKSGVLTEDQRRGILATMDSSDGAAAVEAGGPFPETEEAAAEEGELFELRISSDRLEGHMIPLRQLPDGITMEFIKEFAGGYGIKHGLMDDSHLKGYLAQATSSSQPWLIARGQAPGPSRAARVQYHFNVDPFGVGTIKEGGNIDFRNRGEMPQVSKEDLIAELIPGESGISGMDIYGLVIPAEKPRNVVLRCGKGVQKSNDGLQAFAKIDGRPVLSADGLLSVFPELTIPGDVCYETGHLDFDGHIEIRGAITEGFRVQGGSLVCAEINKAEAETGGDATVLGGIIGSKVKTNGNLRARYVQNSTLEALGDVVMEKEIYHSTVECDGICVSSGGTILGSNITAKNGTESTDIGSDASKPSVIQIGVGARVRKMVEEIKEKIARIRQRQELLDELIADLHEKLEHLYRRIGELDLAWDLSEAQRISIQRKLDKSGPATDPGQIQKVEDIIERLETAKQEAAEPLGRFAADQEENVEKIIHHREEIESLDLETAELNTEIDQLVQWSEAEEKVPSVKVSGTVYPGTTIKGRYAVYVFKEKLKSVLVREVRVEDEHGRSIWQMAVKSLK